MKSGLYAIDYSGASGTGAATICIGGGRFAGFDVGGGTYVGKVDQESPVADFTATVVFPFGGTLVTGQPAPPGTKLLISGRFAPHGGSGGQCVVNVNGHEVSARITPVE